MDLGLNVLSRGRRLDVKGYGLARKSLDEDLYTNAEAYYKEKCRLLMNVVIRMRTASLKLLTSKDEALPV